MRSIWVVVVCALVACNSKKEWKTDSKLRLNTASSHPNYRTISELDEVQPKLIVEGTGALRDAVEAKLKAAGAGKDGMVKVELAMRGSVSGNGVLEIQVRFEGSWGGGAQHHTIKGDIQGSIKYESSRGASAELTAEIGGKLADEVLKELAKAKPKDAGPPKPPAPAIAVGTGLHMTCSLHKDGTVRCWGTSRLSSLSAVPFPIANLEGAVEIAIGDQIGCARLPTGGVRCWDAQRWKEEDAVYGASPVCGVEDVVALSGGSPTCALKPDGSVVCWGSTGFEAGCAQSDAKVVPKLTATKLATSFFNACAIDRKGQVACWDSCDDKCRDANLALVKHPALAGATVLAVGGLPCAILKDDVVRCELDRQSGIVDVTVPGATVIANEFTRRFAITKDHEVYAWANDAKPAVVPGVKGTDISASSEAACVVTETGEVWCWDRDNAFARVVYSKP